jgi:succinate-semialdehyde dehydrogenase / glutarate-semialdehyde dehydrogenase
MAVALKDIRNAMNDASLLKEACYIDGEWVKAEDGKTIDVSDPATGETLGTVPSMGVAETKRAIEAAEAALPAWRAKTGKERSAILRKWFDLIIEAKDDLAYLMTREQGKPLAEAAGEVVYGASFVEWFAEEGKRVYGDVIPQTWARAASWRSSSRWVSVPRSRPGTSPMR